MLTNDITLNLDQFLYQKGELLDGLFVVKSGAINLCVTSEMGEVVVEVVREGGFLEIENALGESPVSYSAKAATKSVVTYIPILGLDQYIKSHPLKAMDLLMYLSDRLDYYNDKLTIGESSGYSEDAKVEIIQNEDVYQISNERKYLKSLPIEHQQYLLVREVTCPVCDQEFRVNTIKASKMDFEKMDDDFRKHFYDIDELWYQIWRCPFCHYANFSNEFHRINNLVRAELKVALPRYERPQYRYLVKESYQQVFDEIYAMNMILNQITKSSFSKARLWQSYAWLLEDVGDTETALEARRITKLYYEDAWYNGNTRLDRNDEVKLAIKLAILSREFNETKEAKNYLLKAIQMKPSNKVLMKRAQDMLYDMRQSNA